MLGSAENIPRPIPIQRRGWQQRQTPAIQSNLFKQKDKGNNNGNENKIQVATKIPLENKPNKAKRSK
jgi:hypothetical protein